MTDLVKLFELESIEGYSDYRMAVFRWNEALLHLLTSAQIAVDPALTGKISETSVHLATTLGTIHADAMATVTRQAKEAREKLEQDADAIAKDAVGRQAARYRVNFWPAVAFVGLLLLTATAFVAGEHFGGK